MRFVGQYPIALPTGFECELTQKNGVRVYVFAQIVGWEMYPTDAWQQIMALYQRQLEHLRKHFPCMTILVGVECNNTWVPGMIEVYTAKLRPGLKDNVCMIHEHRRDNAPPWEKPGIGIHTNNKSKIHMVSVMKNMLVDILAFSSDDMLLYPLIYAPPGETVPTDAKLAAENHQSLQEFKRQLSTFEKVVSKSGMAETYKFTYNGKANNQTDDIVMAALMMGEVFWNVVTSPGGRYDEIRAHAFAL